MRERGHNFWGRGHNFKQQYLRTARTVCHDLKLERRLKTPREGIVPSPRSGRLRGERADVRNHDDRSKIEVMNPIRILTVDEIESSKTVKR